MSLLEKNVNSICNEHHQEGKDFELFISLLFVYYNTYQDFHFPLGDVLTLQVFSKQQKSQLKNLLSLKLLLMSVRIPLPGIHYYRPSFQKFYKFSQNNKKVN